MLGASLNKVVPVGQKMLQKRSGRRNRMVWLGTPHPQPVALDEVLGVGRANQLWRARQ
jgi:hypothetical protein